MWYLGNYILLLFIMEPMKNFYSELSQLREKPRTWEAISLKLKILSTWGMLNLNGNSGCLFAHAHF